MRVSMVMLVSVLALGLCAGEASARFPRIRVPARVAAGAYHANNNNSGGPRVFGFYPGLPKGTPAWAGWACAAAFFVPVAGVLLWLAPSLLGRRSAA